MLSGDYTYISWLTFEQISKNYAGVVDKQIIRGIVFYKHTFIVFENMFYYSPNHHLSRKRL